MIITIYELMGLIKDGKPPKSIEYNGKRYYYNFGDYYNIDNINLFNNDEVKKSSVKEILNFKVEILSEENDEWEDIEEIDNTDFMSIEDRLELLRKWTNSIIKNQKHLKERLDKDE